MNRSIYIIKPEAMPFREEIRKMICLAGLKIIRTTEAIIPIDVLDKLYTDCSDELRRATQLFMGCEPCEIGGAGNAQRGGDRNRLGRGEEGRGADGLAGRC